MIRTGDTVRHIPSGEKWLVAYVQGGLVCACSWPGTRVAEKDCHVIRSAGDQESEDLLKALADTNLNDERKAYAVRELERRRIEREAEAHK